MSTEKNNAYYVRSEELDSDLVVVAPSIESATEIWREYYEHDDSDKPDWVGLLPGLTPDRPVGAIPWADVNPTI